MSGARGPPNGNNAAAKSTALKRRGDKQSGDKSTALKRGGDKQRGDGGRPRRPTRAAPHRVWCRGAAPGVPRAAAHHPQGAGWRRRGRVVVGRDGTLPGRRGRQGEGWRRRARGEAGREAQRARRHKGCRGARGGGGRSARWLPSRTLPPPPPGGGAAARPPRAGAWRRGPLHAGKWGKVRGRPAHRAVTAAATPARTPSGAAAGAGGGGGCGGAPPSPCRAQRRARGRWAQQRASGGGVGVRRHQSRGPHAPSSISAQIPSLPCFRRHFDGPRKAC